MPQTHMLLSLPDPESHQQLSHLLRRQAPHCQVISEIENCRQKPLCQWVQRLPAGSLGDVQACLDDAIEVLERSRHAFKSMQLAELRKRLSLLREELSTLGNYGKT